MDGELSSVIKDHNNYYILKINLFIVDVWSFIKTKLGDLTLLVKPFAGKLIKNSTLPAQLSGAA